MTATLIRDLVALARNAGLRLPRVLPGQEWRPATPAERHLLAEAQRLDRIRESLLAEIGRLRTATPPRERSELARLQVLRNSPLTAGQLEALAAAAHGETIEDTARRLHVTPDTVKSARQRAARRLGAHGMVQAVALAVAAGWIPVDTPAPDGDTP
ncbi:LuxR C-terminal-related transcriptional regulator [Streptomyces sp. NPDC048584]|uniref:helix-turn-helix transcriptional regulator n=1 Tax=Streptomyces sp. NPDC048584 TaxID=3365573 RepID=UPI00371EB12A